MKKFLTVGALALIAAAFFHQHAFAWKNSQFSVGLNWSCQSGGNNLLWGVFRNGQPGAPDWECQKNCGYTYPSAGYPMMSNPMAGPTAFPPAMNFQAPAPTPAAAPTPHSQLWYNYPGYQTVNYAPYDYGFSYMFP